jgi:hypothetical protein
LIHFLFFFKTRKALKKNVLEKEMTSVAEQLGILIPTGIGFVAGTILGFCCDMLTYHPEGEKREFFNSIVKPLAIAGATVGFYLGGGVILFKKLLELYFAYGPVNFPSYLVSFAFIFVIYKLFFSK